MEVIKNVPGENQLSITTTKIGSVLPKKFTVYHPENLDLDKLLVKNPPLNITLRNKEFIKDNIAYILHLITYLPSVKKDYDYEENDGFVPVNSTKLQKSGIHDYKEYFEYLESCNIILKDDSYSSGNYSKSIKFTDKYSFSKIKTYQIKKKTLIKAILKNSEETNSLTQEKYPYLTKWWLSDKLYFDYPVAKAYLELKWKRDKEAFFKKYKMTEIEYYKIQQKKKKRDRLKEDVKYPTFQYNSALMLIDRLHRKQYILKIDATAGRFHTIFTQLPKWLKPFIKYDKKQLVGLDLTNSQPLLATTLLDKEVFNSNPILIDTIRKYNPHHHTTILVNLIEKIQNELDVLEYKKIVSEGQYYEKFGIILQENGLIPEDIKETRGFAKTATFSSFFAPNFDYRYIEAMQHFKKTFPNVYSIFSEIKYAVKGTKKKDKVHSALSVALQALEAELFLDKICKRINETNPNIPIFTIHDSVVTTVGYEDIVQQIIEEETYNTIRIKPKINIEKW